MWLWFKQGCPASSGKWRPKKRTKVLQKSKDRNKKQSEKWRPKIPVQTPGGNWEYFSKPYLYKDNSSHPPMPLLEVCQQWLPNVPRQGHFPFAPSLTDQESILHQQSKGYQPEEREIHTVIPELLFSKRKQKKTYVVVGQNPDSEHPKSHFKKTRVTVVFPSPKRYRIGFWCRAMR